MQMEIINVKRNGIRKNEEGVKTAGPLVTAIPDAQIEKKEASVSM